MTTTIDAVVGIGNRALEQDFRLMRDLVREAPLRWVAVKTGPREENRASERIRDAGIVSYLPMVPDLRKAVRSKKNIDCSRPMFARYVFAGCRDLEFSTAMIRGMEGVEAVLSSSLDGRAHVIPASQMLPSVEAAQIAQLRMKSFVGQSFEIGDGVAIVAGEANELGGLVREVDESKGRARVSVVLFGSERSVSVPLDKLRSV